MAQVLAGVRGHSPPFDGDSEADIEPMNVPHHSKMDNHFASPMLDDIYDPAIPESEGQVEEPVDEIVLQPMQQHSQQRMGYFDLYPERRPLHLNQDDEDLHELNIRAPVENEVEPTRRSDVTTESVYSSSGNNHSPPASPKTAVAPDPRLLRPLETTTLPPKSPQQQATTSTPIPLTPTQTPTQTPTYSPRDLQRQQEVRDRLSGKPGAKAGALIEM